MSWPASPSWKNHTRAIAGTTDYQSDLSIEADYEAANRYKAEWDVYTKTSSATIEIREVEDIAKRKVFLTCVGATAAAAYEAMMNDAKAVQALIQTQDTNVAAANADPAGGALTFAASISFTISIATP